MKLIFSGGFVNQEGLYEASIESVEFPRSLEEVKEEGFYVFSYDLSRSLIGIEIKESEFPKIIKLKIANIRPYTIENRGSYALNFVKSSLSKEEFKQAIEKIKDYIKRGVVYQVNLTNRFDFAFSGALESFFWDFFNTQPTPYAFYLDLEDFCIISGSMELFLERRGNILISKPIKGTGTRSDEILNSPKEKAENLMITDMVRNDLGRVANPGTVIVKELFNVQVYSTLCQMHSTVYAETDRSFFEVFSSTFPPASVTGAPKLKAIQIIDLLEKHPRSYYCGCAGFLGGKDFTLSLLIRTAIKTGNVLSYYSGCGIVWESDEEREWQEVLLKTKAFTRLEDLQP